MFNTESVRGSREEYQLREGDKRIVSAQSAQDISAAIETGAKVYLTIDVDFFDPGFFPGTGTPEAGGAAYGDFISVVRALQLRNVKIVGADLVEFAPQIDSTGNSTVFAAKLLRDLLISIDEMN